MIFAANVLLLSLLSFFPGDSVRKADPHGLHRFSNDEQLRDMASEGRFSELNAAVEGFVFVRASIDLKRRLNTNGVAEAVRARGDLVALLDTIKAAMKVATLAAELQALGPTKGMLQAVQWVESGLIRRSGIKAPEFPSFFGLVEDPAAKKYGSAAAEGLTRDLAGSRARMDASYASLLGQLMQAAPPAAYP